MTTPLIFEVGINFLWPGEKLPEGDRRWGEHTRGFVKESHTIESLAEAVAVRGYAICAVLRNGYRSGANFISAQHLGLDYDLETFESSIEGLQENQFIRDHAAIIHETASSTPEKPRSRVIFILDSSITDAAAYRQAAEALVSKFGTADPYCKDAARLFFGRMGARHVVLGNVLYRDVLQQQVVEPFLAARKARTNGYHAPAHRGETRKPGRQALDFVANGAPMGTQRMRAISAARSYLLAGHSADDTAAALMRGFQAGPQDPSDPWAWEHALFISQDLEKRPLPDMGATVTPPPGDHPAPDAPGTPAETPAISEVGNAQRFAARHGDSVRYCWDWSTWLVWDGRRWAKDRTGAAVELAKDTARHLYEQITNEKEEERRKKLARLAIATDTDRGIRAMLSLARSEPGIPVLPDQLDSDGWALNVDNGLVDLKECILLPHARAHLVSRLAPVSYFQAADCPRWLKFLDEIMGENPAMVGYLQRAVGYCLTGDVSEHCLFVLYGTGRNGKSTFLNTVMEMLGDYAVKCSPDLLMTKKGDQHPTTRATLQGYRFAVAIETAEGRRLDESLVKDLTGGDMINARRMRQDESNFKPTHKLWLATNHKPVIRGTDLGIWSRVRLIPFTVTILPERQEKHLAEKLHAELPGVLRWAIEGCRAWQQVGLLEPLEVKAATADYRNEMDVVGQFLSECCQLAPEGSETAAALLASYEAWAKANGEQRLSQRALGSSLPGHGLKRDRGAGGATCYKGVRLIGQ